jgi:hypothetical protein
VPWSAKSPRAPINGSGLVNDLQRKRQSCITGAQSGDPRLRLSLARFLTMVLPQTLLLLDTAQSAIIGAFAARLEEQKGRCRILNTGNCSNGFITGILLGYRSAIRSGGKSL